MVRAAGITGFESKLQTMRSRLETSGSVSTEKTWIRINFIGITDQNIEILGSGINVSGSQSGITIALAYHVTIKAGPCCENFIFDAP